MNCFLQAKTQGYKYQIPSVTAIQQEKRKRTLVLILHLFSASNRSLCSELCLLCRQLSLHSRELEGQTYVRSSWAGLVHALHHPAARSVSRARSLHGCPQPAPVTTAGQAATASLLKTPLNYLPVTGRIPVSVCWSCFRLATSSIGKSVARRAAQKEEL